MNEADIAGIADWIVQRGLAGDDEITLLHGFCERCVAAELEITRGIAIIDTLHPVYEGRVFYWSGDKPPETLISQYEPTTGSQDSGWLNSPFYDLLQSGEDEMRRRLHLGETADFSVLEELRLEGQTDWLAMVQRFDKEAAIGEMDCFMSRWTTARPGGFADADVAALRRLVPVLGLAIKSVSLARVAQSLVEAYLGRDAGRRVLAGKVSRGAAERINAVIWFSDMQGYTSLSERIESDELLPLLNDYSEVAITSVHAAGGDVLKLMADGVLAIFTADDPAEACAAALQCGSRVAAENRRPQRAPVGGRSAGLVNLPRPAHRRRLLRQHRQQGSARLHRRRPGRQRGEPHRLHVPVGRSRRAVLVGFQGVAAGSRAAEAGVGGPLRAEGGRAAAGTLHARPGDCRRFMTGGSCVGKAQASATKVCFCVPSPSMPSSTTSPFFRNFGGFMPRPTPGGVPVEMMSPGSSDMNWLR